LAMNCDKCGEERSLREHRFVKCDKCGATVRDFFERPPGGWKLRVVISDGGEEVRITGDRAGLEYLASCALAAAGRLGPDGHFHLDPLMYNLSEGSVPVLLEFDADPDGRIPPAASGKKQN